MSPDTAMLGDYMLDTGAATGGAQKFPAAASLRISFSAEDTCGDRQVAVAERREPIARTKPLTIASSTNQVSKKPPVSNRKL
jgi:hypothetical protein